MTPATLIAILSLLRRTAAPSKPGLRLEHAAFSPIGLVAVSICVPVWRYSSDWLRRIFLWGRGPTGKDRGKSGARRGPGARDIAKMKKEEKRMKRVDGKAAGDYSFITCKRIGLADGARADAIPNAAAVRAVTGR